jgi:hypothetical protein
MKKVTLLFILCFTLFSCEKDKKYPENPDWLNEKISQMETPAYYVGTVVYAYEWNKDYYYLISIGLSSCAMCEFYDYQGVKVEWTNDKIADFQKNSKRLKVVWERGFN